MSTEPRPLPGPTPARLRQRARRGAESVSGALVPIVGAAIAVLFVVIFVVLDYTLHQSSARLIKVLLGATGAAGIAMMPAVGLFLFPIVSPLLLLLPKLPVPGLNTTNLLVLGIFMPWAFTRVLRRRPFMRTGMLSAPLLALIALVGLSVLRGWAFPTGFTYDTGTAWLVWFRVTISFTAYFIPLAMVTGAPARRRMAWAIVLALLAESAYTILSGKVTHQGRALGSIDQPNDLGAYLAIASAFSLAMVFGVRAWWQRGALLAITALGLAALMLSASRAAVVAVGVAALVVVWRSSRWALAGLVLVMVLSPLWMPDTMKQRITSTTVQSGDSDDTQLEGSSQERIDTWHTILQVVEDHALDGIGFTGLASVLPQMGAEAGLNVKDSAHNTYLRMLSETGILGLALFLFVLWRGWRLGERAMRAARTRFDRQLALGVVAGIIALVISCMFGDRFWQIMVTANLWVASALADDIVIERDRETA